MAAILTGCGMLLFVAQHTDHQDAITSTGDSAVIPPKCIPAETDQPVNYPVGFTVPKQIAIDALGVDSKVIPVTAIDGVLQIPEDVNEIGWYQEGATPEGLAGSAVLVGHRDGKFGTDGAFYDLAQLKPGDIVKITDAGGMKSEYEVVSREVISKKTFTSVSEKYFTLEGEPRLTLISCGGYYDKDKGGYQANVIITAKRILQASLPGLD